MMTQKESAELCRQGEELKHYFLKTIGRLLLEERITKRLYVEKVSQITKINPNKIEEVELGRHHTRWHILARLLKLYKKRLEVNIVDIE